MTRDRFSNKAEAFEAHDDVPINPRVDLTIGGVIARRYGRRDVLSGLGVTTMTALFGGLALGSWSGPLKAAAVGHAFRELPAGVDESHHVAEGYDAEVLIRWGDPLVPGLAPFDPQTLRAGEQAQRFGYNNDYIAFFPLDETGARGLLCVNHEYTSPEVMFPGVARPDRNGFADMAEARVAVEMAAHGVSVVEIALIGDRWVTVLDSTSNRRVLATTPMIVDGPAAGHDRMRTSADPTGRLVLGTLNNCGGGQTPWGAYLTAEENFHGYFWTDQTDATGKRKTRGLGGAQDTSYSRYGVPASWYNWGAHVGRFNVDKEPNEPNRFGWIVEIDPFDPTSTPVKHTALGRFRHEGAELILNKDGRVVVYSGDDSTFEYVYRFVSKEQYRPGDAPHNRRLLSEGTLSVARYEEDGSATWCPSCSGRARSRPPTDSTPRPTSSRRTPRRRPAARHPDGPPRGRAAEFDTGEGVGRADQQRQAPSGAGRPRQSAP